MPRLIAPSRDTHNNWTDKDPVIFEGVFGLTKDRLFPGSLEYFLGDGVHKYSELPKYGGAEASILNKAYTLVLRDANGKIDSDSIDFPEVPDATPTIKGIVKASANQATDNAIKSDANGSLDGWREALADTLADANGGLIKNPSTGKLNVDFSQMPTDKFEELLKSLKMLIPLTANLNLYVDTNSSAAADTIIDGRGTEALPFKTIQAAVNYATGTYALGNYNIRILVATGTYNESVTLPDFSRGTGHIEIITKSGERDVIVNAVLDSNGTRQACFGATGGTWVISYMDARRIENPTTARNFPAVGCYMASNSGTTLSLYGVAARQSVPNVASFDSSSYACRVISADYGATVSMRHSKMPFIIETATITGGPSVVALHVSRKGTLNLYRSSNDTLSHDVNCSGSCSAFLSVSQGGQVSRISTGSAFNFTGTVTGKRYDLTTGSSVVVDGNADFFPGDTEGTVETSTYCWYA